MLWMLSNPGVNLSGKKITEKTFFEAVYDMPVRRLRVVDISNNLLTKLHSEESSKTKCFFEDFSELEELNISKNPIELINPNCFHSLTSLRIFKADDLLISKESSFKFLKNLTSARQISLRNHRVYSLKPHILLAEIKKTFPFLEELDLRPIGSAKKFSLTNEEKKIVFKFCPTLRKLNDCFISPASEELKTKTKAKENIQKVGMRKLSLLPQTVGAGVCKKRLNDVQISSDEENDFSKEQKSLLISEASTDSLAKEKKSDFLQMLEDLKIESEKDSSKK